MSTRPIPAPSGAVHPAPMGSMFHPALGPVQYATTEVSADPDTQVAQVIGMMRDYAVTDSASPEVRRDLATARATFNTGDPIQDVFQWVKSRMRFVRDEDTAQPFPYAADVVETLVRPRDIAVAESAQGDCDDYSMYGASLLHAANIPTAFVTVAADAQAPDVYSHVYLVTYPPGRGRIPLDLSHGPYPGWETENHFGKRAEWPLTGCSGFTWLAIGAGLVYLAHQEYLKRRREGRT